MALTALMRQVQAEFIGIRRDLSSPIAGPSLKTLLCPRERFKLREYSTSPPGWSDWHTRRDHGSSGVGDPDNLVETVGMKLIAPPPYPRRIPTQVQPPT